MTELFPELLEKAQKAVEECLDGTGYNPISVITGETFNIVGDLTDGEISRLIAERPAIMRNRVELQDPPPRSVSFGEIAREAVAMEIQKSIDMAPLADAITDWHEAARIPAHLAESVRRVLVSQTARP